MNFDFNFNALLLLFTEVQLSKKALGRGLRWLKKHREKDSYPKNIESVTNIFKHRSIGAQP